MQTCFWKFLKRKYWWMPHIPSMPKSLVFPSLMTLNIMYTFFQLRFVLHTVIPRKMSISSQKYYIEEEKEVNVGVVRMENMFNVNFCFSCFFDAITLFHSRTDISSVIWMLMMMMKKLEGKNRSSFNLCVRHEMSKWMACLF